MKKYTKINQVEKGIIEALKKEIKRWERKYPGEVQTATFLCFGKEINVLDSNGGEMITREFRATFCKGALMSIEDRRDDALLSSITIDDLLNQ